MKTLDDFENAPETVEDGETLAQNALKKARAIRAFTGCSALADDTGLFVDALGGAPGVYSARYSGENATYESNCLKLLEELEHVADDEDRRAQFKCVIVVALCPSDAARVKDYLAANPEQRFGVRANPGPHVDALVAEGIIHGRITRRARGQAGFGYDPVFEVAHRGQTLAEMTAEEKNSTSHRYRALVETRELLLRFGLAEER